MKYRIFQIRFYCYVVLAFSTFILGYLAAKHFLKNDERPLNRQIKIIPHPQEIGFKRDRNDFKIDANTMIVASDEPDPKDQAAYESLNHAIVAQGLAPLPIVRTNRFEGKRNAWVLGRLNHRFRLLDSLVTARDMLSTPPTMRSEEYRLDVDSNFVVLLGIDDAAIFFGIQTLIQLFKPGDHPGECNVAPVRIRDFPDMPLRSAFYGFHLGNLDNDSLLKRGYNDITKFSRYKFNMIGLDNPHYSHLEMEIPDGSGKKYGERFAEIFAVARKYHLEPRVGGMARWFSRKPSPWSDDLTLLEGIRTTQIINMAGTQEYPLKISSGQIARKVMHDFKTGRSWKEEPVVVTDSTGNIVYAEGNDYEIAFGRTEHPFFTRVIEGEGEPAGYPIRRGESDESPTMIRRTSRSRIQDEQTVKVTFSYIGPDPWSPYKVRYCRSDSRIHADGPQNFIWRWCVQPVTYLDARLFNLEMDEIRVFAWDKRCLDSGKSRSQIFADDVKYYYDTIKKHVPDARIIMWSDMVDANHHATLYKTEGVLDRLRDYGMTDIIMAPWDHTCAEKSIGFFADNGFSVLASSQAQEGNISIAPLWAKLLREKFKNTDRLYGLMHAPWEYDYDAVDGWERVATAADHAWSIAPYIIHLPIREAERGNDLKILAHFEGDQYIFDGEKVGPGPLPLISAVVYFCTENQPEFQKIKMKKNGHQYVAIIPGEFVTRSTIEYYIEMADKFNVSRAPKSAPEFPYKITVQNKVKFN